MSTALGTTVDNGGESGTISNPVRPIPDTLPDNPATLAANTSIETLECIMYRDWVWRNNFTVDSAMLPGHVFGLIKVHPRNCNDYITHISQMFLSWTGSFKIRTRFMATFQFGGSLRVGFLPPKFTEAEVQALPIQTLTAYPNVDLDPKNTAWTHFQAPDERNVLFHWMSELQDQSVESFGGYFVFYVASPLVVSGGQNTSVSLLVEAAGNFQFSQLSPISKISPSVNKWIDSDYIIGQTGCDDGIAITGIQVLPANIKTLTTGYWMSQGLASEPITSIPNINVSEKLRAYIKSYHDGNQMILPMAEGNFELGDPAHIRPNILGINVNANSEVSAYGYMARALRGDAVGTPNYESQATGLVLEGTLVSAVMPKANVAGDTTVGYFGALRNHNTFTQPINTTDLINSDEGSFANTLDGESIVGFVNTSFRSFNTQTIQQRQFLARVKTFSPNMSQLYQLRKDGQDTPLLTLRLTPYGFWTTRATDVVALLREPRLYLTYLQDLPMNVPIPSGTYEGKFLRYAGRATQKNLSALGWDVNVYNLCK